MWTTSMKLWEEKMADTVSYENWFERTTPAVRVTPTQGRIGLYAGIALIVFAGFRMNRGRGSWLAGFGWEWATPGRRAHDRLDHFVRVRRGETVYITGGNALGR